MSDRMTLYLREGTRERLLNIAEREKLFAADGKTPSISAAIEWLSKEYEKEQKDGGKVSK